MPTRRRKLRVIGGPLHRRLVLSKIRKQIAEHGRPPESLAEYVAWSQNHQSEALTMALAACLKRFPAIGGLIFWMGHDSFPCLANTSLLDFHGRPKPAARAMRQLMEQHRSHFSAELPGSQSPHISAYPRKESRARESRESSQISTR